MKEPKHLWQVLGVQSIGCPHATPAACCKCDLITKMNAHQFEATPSSKNTCCVCVLDHFIPSLHPLVLQTGLRQGLFVSVTQGHSLLISLHTKCRLQDAKMLRCCWFCVTSVTPQLVARLLDFLVELCGLPLVAMRLELFEKRRVELGDVWTQWSPQNHRTQGKIKES